MQFRKECGKSPAGERRSGVHNEVDYDLYKFRRHEENRPADGRDPKVSCVSRKETY
jgi:hypothetical protein